MKPKSVSVHPGHKNSRSLSGDSHTQSGLRTTVVTAQVGTTNTSESELRLSASHSRGGLCAGLSFFRRSTYRLREWAGAEHGGSLNPLQSGLIREECWCGSWCWLLAPLSPP